jgi:protoporphyrinogen/coproporphyrinogen III oxidase
MNEVRAQKDVQKTSCIKTICILGAGITGLSLAYFLLKKNPELHVTLLDEKNEVGGWIETKIEDGFQYECGPRSLRASHFDIARELGLEDELILASPHAQEKYIALNGKLERVPQDVLSLFTEKIGHKILKGLASYPIRALLAAKSKEDVSIDTYFRTRFGCDFTDSLINPLMAGIYAADPKLLSYESAMIKRQKGAQLFSFKSGMQTLPKALAKAIQKFPQAKIYCSKKVRSLREYQEKVVVETEKDELFFCDHLFCTQSIERARDLFVEEDPIAKLLPEVPKSSVLTVTLGWKADCLTKSGFGFLVPAHEEKELLGVIFDSKVFPEQNGEFPTRLSIMMGGTRAPFMLNFDDQLALEKAAFFCKKYLEITLPFDACGVVRTKNAISLYPVGYLEKRQKLEEHMRFRKITFLGAGLYGVSLGECMQRAEEMALRYFDITK